MENKTKKSRKLRQWLKRVVLHRLGIATATAFLIGKSNKYIIQPFLKYFFTKHSIYKTVLTILILYAPFVHVHAKVGQPGFGDYQFMMSFLWAIGYPITGFFLGLFNLYYAKKSKTDRKFRVILSYGVMMVAAFYIVIAFFPMTKEYTLLGYNSLFASIAILSVFIIVFISEKARLIEDTIKDKEKLNEAIKLIFRLRNKHFMEVGTRALYAEMHDRAMESDKTVKEITEEMEEDVLATTEKIVDLP